jgi:hypothetical protein
MDYSNENLSDLQQEQALIDRGSNDEDDEKLESNRLNV